MAVLGLAGGLAVSTSTPSCSAGGLTATFTTKPLSSYGAFVHVTLTIRNSSGSACVIPASPKVILLDSREQPMPTDLHRVHPTTAPVLLVPDQWAQADAMVRAIQGPGDPRNCEPFSMHLGIQIDGHRLVSATEPLPVCQHGRIQLGALHAVEAVPLCRVAHLSARYYELGDGKADDGTDEYTLQLINHGTACGLNGMLRLRLVGIGGRLLPTHVDRAIAVPIVIRANGSVSSLATMFFERMPGSRGPGYCGRRALQIRVSPLGVSGSVLTFLRPSLRPCYHGTIGDLALVSGQPFE